MSSSSRLALLRNGDRKYKTRRVLADFFDSKDCALHMDVLPRITRQLIELFHAMSPVVRVTSIVIACAVLAAFASLVVQGNQPGYQSVSFGKVFTNEELSSAERALTSAGLKSFRRDGQRLLAPAGDLDKYNATLLESDAFPADLGSQIIKQFETLGPFSTDRQRQQMKEALLLQELRRMIMAVPDIEDARVAIAAAERRGSWNQKARPTANVSVKPRAGRELSTTLVNSLRQVVANTVPDLKPADVTIFDVTRGQAYSGEPTDFPTDQRYLQRARSFTRQYEQQIQKALSHIPHVSVAVHVDLPTRKSSVEPIFATVAVEEPVQIANRAGTIDDSHSHVAGFRGGRVDSPPGLRGVTDDSSAAVPKSVQVSVAIPRDYLDDVRRRERSKEQKSTERIDLNNLEEEILTTVERIVGRLIPPSSSPDAISVTYVDRVAEDPLRSDSPAPNLLEIKFVGQWAAVAGVCGILLISLFAIRRPSSSVGVTKAPQETVAHEPPPIMAPLVADLPRTLAVPQERATSLRDEIRSMVESDTTGTATLLSHWLAEV